MLLERIIENLNHRLHDLEVEVEVLGLPGILDLLTATRELALSASRNVTAHHSLRARVREVSTRLGITLGDDEARIDYMAEAAAQAFALGYRIGGEPLADIVARRLAEDRLRRAGLMGN